MIKLCAIDGVIASVKEVVLRISQSDRGHPVPHPLCQFEIRVVPRINSQASSHVEEAAIRDGVLIVVAVVEGEDLPLQPAPTGGGIPTRCLGVEDSLCESEPLRLIFRRVWKDILCCRESGHSPERLVIVAFGLCLVGRHEVIIWAGLVQHGLDGDLVEGSVAGKIPIVDQGPEHGTSFPPVVRGRKVTRYISRSVPGVVGHHLVGYDLRCGFHRIGT